MSFADDAFSRSQEDEYPLEAAPAEAEAAAAEAFSRVLAAEEAEEAAAVAAAAEAAEAAAAEAAEALCFIPLAARINFAVDDCACGCGVVEELDADRDLGNGVSLSSGWFSASSWGAGAVAKIVLSMQPSVPSRGVTSATPAQER